MRRPKISTASPFNYNEVVKNCKFTSLGLGCVNLIYETDTVNKMCTGVNIALFGDGISVSGKFSMPSSLIDSETIETDVDAAICKWLTSVNESEMIQDIDPISNKPIEKQVIGRKPAIGSVY